MRGTIKWFNVRKGYGFLLGDDGKDVFVHHSVVPVGIILKEGDKVEYDIEESPLDLVGGPKAINLRRDGDKTKTTDVLEPRYMQLVKK